MGLARRPHLRGCEAEAGGVTRASERANNKFGEAQSNLQGYRPTVLVILCRINRMKEWLQCTTTII